MVARPNPTLLAQPPDVHSASTGTGTIRFRRVARPVAPVEATAERRAVNRSCAEHDQHVATDRVRWRSDTGLVDDYR
jgi:hypothetical protein